MSNCTSAVCVIIPELLLLPSANVSVSGTCFLFRTNPFSMANLCDINWDAAPQSIIQVESTLLFILHLKTIGGSEPRSPDIDAAEITWVLGEFEVLGTMVLFLKNPSRQEF